MFINEFIPFRPNEINAPTFERGNGYVISSGKGTYSVGSFIGISEEIDHTKKYIISVACVKTENAKVSAHVFFLDEEKHPLTMEYMVPCENGFCGEFFPVEKTKYIKIEYLFSCFGQGQAEFSVPKVQIADVTDRVVTVATAYFYPAWFRGMLGDIDANVPYILKIIDNAGKDKNKPDILCFTETAYDRGTGLSFAEMAVPESCDIMEKVKEKAREYKMHIIFSIHEKAEEGIYNTSYVISDEGTIIGKHRKTQITYSEVVGGMLPGNVLEPIETKFGKIGIMICWEQWYPEVARKLVKKGAEMLFVCTAGDPVEISRARARENGVFVIISGTANEGNGASSRIIDKRGNIVTCVTDIDKGYASYTIDLNKRDYARYLGVSGDVELGGDAQMMHLNEIRNDIV